MSQNEIESVQKVLGEPVYGDFSDAVRKMRNHLLIVSSIALFAVIGGIEISLTSSFFGLEFTGLTNTKVFGGLLAVECYVLAHFLWCSLDSFFEWRVRITGTRTAFVTAGKWTDKSGDYPDDPRQSTLYNWWKDEAKKIGAIGEIAERAAITIEECKKRVMDDLTGSDPNVRVYVDSAKEVESIIRQLNSSVHNGVASLAEMRIPASLDRFDKAFKLLLRSQNIRWLLLEIGFPMLLGLAGIIALCWKLYTQVC